MQYSLIKYAVLGSCVLLLNLFSSTDSYARTRCCDAKCEETKQKIDRIQSKMRRGYKVAEGERLKDELRRLRKLRSKYCR